MYDTVVLRSHSNGEGEVHDVEVLEAPDETVVSYGLLAEPFAFLGRALALDAKGRLVFGTINPAVYEPTGFSEVGVVLRKVS